MAKKLTAVAVANAKPGKARREVSDGASGLWLVVQPGGAKSWAVRYRTPDDRRPRKLTLKATSLADARKQAAAALHEVHLGRDPAAKLFAEKRAKAEQGLDTVDALALAFLARQEKATSRSHWRQCERVFRKEVLPAWSGKTVHEVRRRDVVALVERIAEDRPVFANRTHSILNAWFNWLSKRDVLQTRSPTEGVERPAKETSRDRFLDDGEIKSLWAACDGIGTQGALIKTLLLTGQRRSEVAQMRWSEVDGSLWTLPPERHKGGQVHHTVPLSTQVVAILEGLPRVSDFVFANAAGDGALSNFSGLKARLDERMKDVPAWRLHDARRTCATGLQRLGVPIHITEAVLGHRSGTISGIAAIYQRHDYLVERATALQRWADHVDAVVTGRQAMVVPFGRR